MKVELASKAKSLYITSDMGVGDVAIITEEGPFKGHFVLRSYDNYVDLNEPSNTWPVSKYSAIGVTPLLTGTVITLTVE